MGRGDLGLLPPSSTHSEHLDLLHVIFRDALTFVLSDQLRRLGIVLTFA